MEGRSGGRLSDWTLVQSCSVTSPANNMTSPFVDLWRSGCDAEWTLDVVEGGSIETTGVESNTVKIERDSDKGNDQGQGLASLHYIGLVCLLIAGWSPPPPPLPKALVDHRTCRPIKGPVSVSLTEYVTPSQKSSFVSLSMSLGHSSQVHLFFRRRHHSVTGRLRSSVFHRGCHPITVGSRPFEFHFSCHSLTVRSRSFVFHKGYMLLHHSKVRDLCLSQGMSLHHSKVKILCLCLSQETSLHHSKVRVLCLSQGMSLHHSEVRVLCLSQGMSVHYSKVKVLWLSQGMPLQYRKVKCLCLSQEMLLYYS